MSRTRLYHEWADMKCRCNVNKQNINKDYAGKGVSVCTEWKKDFLVFMNWAISNGYSDALTIDRIDFNGNYEPSNCRWVSMKDQGNNRKTNRFLTFNGETKTLKQMCEKYGFGLKTVQCRIDKLGWSVDKALSIPTQKQEKRGKENDRSKNNIITGN